MCGENVTASPCFELLIGSPPRVRGKRRKRLQQLTTLGITPACAGKTADLLEKVPCNGDHPRVCGENYFSPY